MFFLLVAGDADLVHEGEVTVGDADLAHLTRAGEEECMFAVRIGEVGGPDECDTRQPPRLAGLDRGIVRPGWELGPERFSQSVTSG